MSAANLDGLLRACKDDPTDDRFRHILADYLEERGDTQRAEFIRLQVDCPDHPNHFVVSPLEKVQIARQNRLARKNASQWLGGRWTEYGGIEVSTRKGNQFARFGFERGLMTLRLGENPLADLQAALPAGVAPWLEKLEAWHSYDPVVLGKICRNRFLQHFTSLEIGWESPNVADVFRLFERARPRVLWLGMEDAGARLLPALATAPWLRPHQLHLKPFAGWDQFAASPVMSELRCLELRTTSDDSLEPLGRAPVLAQLRKLSLSGDAMRAESLGRLLHSEKLANLRELAVASYDGRGNPDIAAALGDCRTLRGLRHLDLFGSGIGGEAGATLLARSPALADIRTLGLYGCAITPPAAQALFASERFHHLEHAQLCSNPLGDSGVAVLATAPTLENLRQLDLNSVGMTSIGARSLAESPRFEQLELLNLALNQVDEVGFEYLARANGPCLRHLALGTARPTRAGWQAISRSPLVRQIVHLEADNLALGAPEVADLAEAYLPELRVLDMGENPFGTRGAQALGAAPWLDQLCVLHLCKTDLDDDGLIALLTGLRSGALAELWIQDNNIGERGARALLNWSGLPHLVSLQLDTASIGEVLMEQLQHVVEVGPKKL